MPAIFLDRGAFTEYIKGLAKKVQIPSQVDVHAADDAAVGCTVGGGSVRKKFKKSRVVNV